MTNTLIAAYLGFGLAAARPATPSTDTAAAPFYYATDTAALSQYIPGTGWVAVGGGYSSGTVPTIVQSQSGCAGGATGGGAGLTMTSAPVNGNLLVAMAFNPITDTAASGWTAIAVNSSGTDFGAILTKTAGASESTTQTPLSGTVATGCMVIWEINGQNATPVVQTVTEAEQTSQTFAVSPAMLPLDTSLLFLGAIGLISSSGNFVNMYGVKQDQFVKTGSTRQIAAGHANLSNYPVASIAATISAASSYKALGLIITH